MEEKVKLTNASGLHARPAGVFVKKAQSFQSKIDVAAKGKVVNGKSLLSLLGLGLNQHDEISILASGPDEAQALAELSALVKSGMNLQ